MYLTVNVNPTFFFSYLYYNICSSFVVNATQQLSEGRDSRSRLGFETEGTETQIIDKSRSSTRLFVYIFKKSLPGLVTKYWKSGKFVKVKVSFFFLMMMTLCWTQNLAFYSMFEYLRYFSGSVQLFFKSSWMNSRNTGI